MKRSISLFIVLAMILSLFSVNVFAEDEHEHDGVVFEAWSDATSLPTTAGNYFLTVDVKLGAAWNTPSGEINFCLNGHTVTNNSGISSSSAIFVYSDSSINIFDCSADKSGTIVSLSEWGCGISNYGFTTINGGTISGDSLGISINNGEATINDGTISGGIANSYGDVTVNGGTITGDWSGINNYDGEVTINGGTIESLRDWSAGIDNYYGEVTVNGGTIKATVDYSNGISNYDGMVTVYDGTITCDMYGIYNYEGGDVTVNGGTISGDSYGISNKEGTLTVNGGTISGIENGSILTVNGGTVNGRISSYKTSTVTEGTINGGITLSRGTLTVTGGTINNEDRYGIFYYTGEALYLSGDAKISGSEADIYLLNGVCITVTGKLENTEPYAVAGKSPCVITDTALEDLEYNDADKFTSADDGYIIIKNGAGQLELAVKGTDDDAVPDAHDGLVFKAWNNATYLPSVPGNYYLTVDVQLEKIWEVPSGEVNLCLNGHTISYDSYASYNEISIPENSSLNIYDHSENMAGTITCYKGDAITNYGELTVNGVTIDVTYWGYGIANYGKLTVNGGTIKGCKYGIYNYEGEANINGATVSSDKSDGIGINNLSGAMHISGGTISGNTCGIYNTGTVTITNSRISGKDYSIFNDGTANVNGGTVSGKYYDINGAEKNYLYPIALSNLGSSFIDNSYLVTTEDGYMRVYCDEMIIGIEYYDSNFNFISAKVLGMELDIWGGFYKGNDAYYLVEGTLNKAESESTEVIRVIKYDFDWNRIGASKITSGSNTVVIPFHSGNVNMAEYNSTLYIATGHEGWLDPPFGKGHQGLVMIAVDESTMEGRFQAFDEWHSFAQYIKADGSDVYLLEQSDGDRCAKLSLYNGDTNKRETEFSIFGYGGSHTSAWSIPCYASVDGLELSDKNVITVGTSIDQSLYDSVSSSTSYNIYITVTPKSDMTAEATTVKWLTDFKDDGKKFKNVKLTKINDNRFLVTWGEYYDVFDATDAYGNYLFSGYKMHYVFIDGNGNKITEADTLDVCVSDCQLIVSGSDVVFSASDDNSLIFYTIDAYTGEISKTIYSDADKDEAFVPGDLNGDGKVDVQDGVLMQRILAKLETNPEYLARADLNGDGKQDVQDGVKMQRILAHLE